MEMEYSYIALVILIVVIGVFLTISLAPVMLGSSSSKCPGCSFGLVIREHGSDMIIECPNCGHVEFLKEREA